MKYLGHTNHKQLLVVIWISNVAEHLAFFSDNPS